MPKRYPARRTRDVTWLTIRPNPTNGEPYVESPPNFFDPNTPRPNVFTRPVLFRGGYLTATGHAQDTGGLGDIYALLMGIGFSDTKDADLKSHPKAYPLIATPLSVSTIGTSFNANTHYVFALQGRTKAMRKIGRGEVIVSSSIGSGTIKDYIGRLLIEVS